MTAVTDRAGSGAKAGRGRLKAAWTLVLLAPLCAEAAFSGISMPLIWLAFPLLVPMYGAGILLLRELARRTGAGWPGLLVLGLAFELAEDGLGLQALTSTHMYSAAAWGPRVLGLNTTYWESQIGYHLAFTVLIPIALTELLFPRHADRPYLRGGGLAGTVVAFVAGVGLLRMFIAGVEDPGYQVPWPGLLGLLAGIAVLVVLALLVLPRLRVPRPAPVARLPRPAALAVLAAVASFAFLALTFPLGHMVSHPAVGHGAWVLIPMAAALVLAVAAGWLVARWSATEGFTDHHTVWLIGGALVGHSAYAVAGGVTGGMAGPALAIGAAVIVVTVLLLARLDRVVRRRAGS